MRKPAQRVASCALLRGSGLCAEGGVEYWKVLSRYMAGSDLCSGSRTLRTAWLICGILQPSFLFGFGMTWREDELGTSLLLIQTCSGHWVG